MFDGTAADVVFYGHDHDAFDGFGDRRYVNPGSVGCSSRAEARFAIVDCGTGDIRVTFRSVPYDDRSVFADLERRQVPLRDKIRRVFNPRD